MRMQDHIEGMIVLPVVIIVLHQVLQDNMLQLYLYIVCLVLDSRI